MAHTFSVCNMPTIKILKLKHYNNVTIIIIIITTIIIIMIITDYFPLLFADLLYQGGSTTITSYKPFRFPEKQKNKLKTNQTL